MCALKKWPAHTLTLTQICYKISFQQWHQNIYLSIKTLSLYHCKFKIDVDTVLTCSCCCWALSFWLSRYLSTERTGKFGVASQWNFEGSMMNEKSNPILSIPPINNVMRATTATREEKWRTNFNVWALWNVEIIYKKIPLKFILISFRVRFDNHSN